MVELGTSTKAGNSWRNQWFPFGSAFGVSIFFLLGSWVALNGGKTPLKASTFSTRSCDLFCWTCWPNGSSGVEKAVPASMACLKSEACLNWGISPRNGQVYQANMGISTRKRGWSDCRVKAKKECGFTMFHPRKGRLSSGVGMDHATDDFTKVPAIRSRQMDIASGAFVSMVVVAPK